MLNMPCIVYTVHYIHYIVYYIYYIVCSPHSIFSAPFTVCYSLYTVKLTVGFYNGRMLLKCQKEPFLQQFVSTVVECNEVSLFLCFYLSLSLFLFFANSYAHTWPAVRLCKVLKIVFILQQ